MSSSVAVLGGGISGLSAAYYLSRMAPASTKILLIEGSGRVGGWIQSHQRVPPGNYNNRTRLPKLSPCSNILFEAGPRSLCPEGTHGAIVLEMIQHLKLNDALRVVPKTRVSIYYDGKINTLPSSLGSLLFHKPPILKSVLLAAALEPFRPSRFHKDGTPRGDEDESIYDFIKRRFNEHTAIHFMGAHGVYTGDVKSLSIQSTFRMLYETEKTYGSVIVGLMRGASHTATMRERGMAVRSRKQDPAWFGRMEKMGGLSFEDGMETLPKRLYGYLQACPNVECITNDPVESITPLQNGNESKIKTKQGEFYAHHIISTLPSFTLENLVSLPHLSHHPASDIAVINFAYDPDDQVDNDDFGFLTVPHGNTPVPGTLGIMYDSPGGMTAMIGGSAFGNTPIDQLDPEIALTYAKRAMREVLNIQADPTHTMVHLQKQCMPHYLVGHQARMRALHHAVKQKYGHLLSLTGASYLGVGVTECIKQSRMVVEELVVSGALGSRKKVVTGLGQTMEGMSVQEMKDSARLSRGNTNVILSS